MSYRQIIIKIINDCETTFMLRPSLLLSLVGLLKITDYLEARKPLHPYSSHFTHIFKMNELRRLRNMAPKLIMVSLKCIVLAMLVLCVVYPSTTLLKIPRPARGASLRSSNDHHQQHMDVHNVDTHTPKDILSTQAKMMVDLVARKVEDAGSSMIDHHVTHATPLCERDVKDSWDRLYGKGCNSAGGRALTERDTEWTMGQWDRLNGKGHAITKRYTEGSMNDWYKTHGQPLAERDMEASNNNWGHPPAERDTEGSMNDWYKTHGHPLAERDTEGSMNDWYKTHGHLLSEKSQDPQGNDISKRHHIRPDSQMTSTQYTTTTDLEIFARGWPRPKGPVVTRHPHPPAAVVARRIHQSRSSPQPNKDQSAVSARSEISARSGGQKPYVCPHHDPWCHYPHYRLISGPLAGGSKKPKPPTGVSARRIPPGQIRPYKPKPSNKPQPPSGVVAREDEHAKRYEDCVIAQIPPVALEDTDQTAPNVQPRRVPCHRPPRVATTTDFATGTTAAEVIEPREYVPEDRVVARCFCRFDEHCTLPGDNIKARGCGCSGCGCGCQSQGSTSIHRRGGDILNTSEPGRTEGCSCNPKSGCSYPKIEKTQTGSFLNGYKCAPDEKPCPWWLEFTNPDTVRTSKANNSQPKNQTTVHKRVDATPELFAPKDKTVTVCRRRCHRGSHGRWECRCDTPTATKRDEDLDSTDTQEDTNSGGIVPTREIEINNGNKNKISMICLWPCGRTPGGGCRCPRFVPRGSIRRDGDLESTETSDENNSTGIAPIMAYLESHESEINNGNISKVDVGPSNNAGTDKTPNPEELTPEQKQMAKRIFFVVIGIVGSCVVSMSLLYLWHLHRRRVMQKSFSHRKPETSQKSFGGMRRIDEDPYEDLGTLPMTLDGANDGWTKWILRKQGNSKPNQLSPTPKNCPPRIPTLRLPQPIFSSVRRANGISTESSMGYDKFDFKGRYGSKAKWTSTV
ncbi:uncharacterized protein PAC_10861 [Phialocephala subalpina]|uniref:Uncharacterized protein n=1 Tax=Phialocephala subalpina TaxID=576137 RepID=A0A1L7X7G4_9HELO|nr:uncharacterized protein PAC_10861 [Phialocephala subalpina]